MQGGTILRWAFDAAQTDLAIVTPAANEALAPTHVEVTCDDDNSVPVVCEIGFGVTTLPAIALNSATGQADIFFSHPGIARGGGQSVANPGGWVGPAGVPIRIRHTVPTGGAIHYSITYSVIVTDA
jgi:hypothetical protein